MSECNNCNGTGFKKRVMGHIWYCSECMGKGECDNK